ncbi:large subunit ribosomal protein L24 [Natronocella acetinitrilica]|jgi:large subunit ribosomal protein L24|uniref:Large ribosomal subunit protein uL24 n=1 Tax=Natronocella acetinitrilica TaxID=414046 RepID=A0AAE3G7M9_9GAMM|nr:50S ribosomal protein L24 [Natronocella acetinitrilica]MCP1676559.1 large subunit ribosomal protein L24 [Natronocella acetinitrilica]
MQKIKKGDEVIVIAGKDKGKRGSVVNVLREKNRVVVENVNVVKKHVRGNPQRGEQGGIQEMEAPLNLSNVALYNPQTKKADRVGIKEVDGKRVRYFKSNNELVDA